jgi:putative membrane protein
MLVLGIIFATVAALLHVAFFLMESVFWTEPAVYERFMVRDEEDAKLLEFAMKQQGFYNLFLALGCLTGVALMIGGQAVLGRMLIFYTCLFMLAAAAVLFLTDEKRLRAALIQGLIPAIALVFTLFSI